MDGCFSSLGCGRNRDVSNLTRVADDHRTLGAHQPMDSLQLAYLGCFIEDDQVEQSGNRGEDLVEIPQRPEPLRRGLNKRLGAFLATRLSSSVGPSSLMPPLFGCICSIKVA